MANKNVVLDDKTFILPQNFKTYKLYSNYVQIDDATFLDTVAKTVSVVMFKYFLFK
jgi:hypothetical protein